MNTSISQIELVCPSGTDELWVIAPILPVTDWPTIRAQLPSEVQDYVLDHYIPLRTDSGWSDGWVLRPVAA